MKLHRRNGSWKTMGFVVALVMAMAFGGVAAEAKTSITVWTWNDLPGQMMAQLADKMNSERDDIEIIVDMFDINGYHDKLLAAYLGGIAPEIVRGGGDANWPGGAFTPFPDDMYEPSLREWMLNQPLDVYTELANREQIDMLPWVLWVPALWYNKTFFDDAGIGEPPTTWDEFIDDSKKLTVQMGDEVTRWGFVIEPDNVSFTFAPQKDPELYALGQQSFTPSEGVIEAYDFARGIVHDHGLAPWPLDNWNGGMFITRRTAMMIAGTWYMGTINDWQGDDDWGITTPPTPDGSGPYGLAVVATDLHFRSQLNPDELNLATEFAKRVYDVDFANELALQTGLGPTIIDYYQDPRMARDAVMSLIGEQVQNSVFNLEGTSWNAVVQTMGQMTAEGLLNNWSPAQWAENVEIEANKRLDDWFRE